MSNGIIAKMFGDALFSSDRMNQEKAYAELMSNQVAQMEQQKVQEQKFQEHLDKREELLMINAKKMALRPTDMREMESGINQMISDIQLDIKENHHGNFQSYLNWVDDNGKNGYEKMKNIFNGDKAKAWRDRQEKNAKFLKQYNDAATSTPSLIPRGMRKTVENFSKENPTVHELPEWIGLLTEPDFSFISEMYTTDKVDEEEILAQEGNMSIIARNMYLDGVVSDPNELFEPGQDGRLKSDNLLKMKNYVSSKYSNKLQEYGSVKKDYNAGEQLAEINQLIYTPSQEDGNWDPTQSFNDFLIESRAIGRVSDVFGVGNVMVEWSNGGISNSNGKANRPSASQAVYTSKGIKSSIIAATDGLGILNEDGELTVENMANGNVYDENGNLIAEEDLLDFWEGAAYIGAGTAMGAKIASWPGALVGLAASNTAYYATHVYRSEDMIAGDLHYGQEMYIIDENTGEGTWHLMKEFKDWDGEPGQEYLAQLEKGVKTRPVLFLEMESADAVSTTKFRYRIPASVDNNASFYTEIKGYMGEQNDMNDIMDNTRTTGKINNSKLKSDNLKDRIVAVEKSNKAVSLIGEHWGDGKEDRNTANNIVGVLGKETKGQLSSSGISEDMTPLMLSEIMVTSKGYIMPNGEEAEGADLAAVVDAKIKNLSKELQKPANKARFDAYKNADKSLSSYFSNLYNEETVNEIRKWRDVFSVLTKEAK